jgi:hypothetical protein
MAINEMKIAIEEQTDGQNMRTKQFPFYGPRRPSGMKTLVCLTL